MDQLTNINPFDVFKYVWLILTQPFMLALLGLYFVFYWLIPSVAEAIHRWLNEHEQKRIDQREKARQEAFNARLRATGVEATDKMTGRDFEQWLKVKFEQMGYKVRLKNGSKDQGVDLVLFKAGKKTVVQAKKRTSQNVGVKALGELLRGMKYHDAHKGIVVTNRYFTREMTEEAKEYDDVELWDRDRLVKEIEKGQQVLLPRRHRYDTSPRG